MQYAVFSWQIDQLVGSLVVKKCYYVLNGLNLSLTLNPIFQIKCSFISAWFYSETNRDGKL